MCVCMCMYMGLCVDLLVWEREGGCAWQGACICRSIYEYCVLFKEKIRKSAVSASMVFAQDRNTSIKQNVSHLGQTHSNLENQYYKVLWTVAGCVD